MVFGAGSFKGRMQADQREPGSWSWGLIKALVWGRRQEALSRAGELLWPALAHLLQPQLSPCTSLTYLAEVQEA